MTKANKLKKSSLVVLVALLLLAFGASCHQVYSDSFRPDDFMECYLAGDCSLVDLELKPEQGAAYLTASFLQDGAYPEVSSHEFFMLSLTQEPAPFGRESGLRLLHILSTDDQTERQLLLRVATLLKERFGGSWQVERELARVWYEMSEHVSLRSQLETLARYTEAQSDIEYWLWMTVLGLETGDLRYANRALRELVLKFPCSDEHWRLARYLEYHEEKYRLLDTSLYEYLKMKADLRLGRTRVSGVQWLALSLDIPYEVRVSDAVRAALLTNTEKITADHLYDGLNTQDFDSRERLATIFQAARLLSRAGYSSIAMRHYEEVIGSRNLTDEIRTEEGQRFLLAYFQTAIRLDFDGGLDSIMEHADSIVFPELFDRLFQDMLSRLVREERWAALSDLYTEAGAYWTEGQRARLAWILAEGSRVGREVKLDRLDLLREAAHQDSNAYYSAVAQVALGKSLKLPLAEVQQEESLVQYEYPLQEYESLAESLYAARLTRLAYMVAREHPEAFDANQLAAFAKVHYEDGQYILGMRLLDRLGRVSDDRRSISQASLQRYPLAFREEMQPVLDRYDLYPPVFIALVREESYFDPGISSHVGANGLAQLMPDTAADMARLLRLKNPDLSDPATNLSIGGLYLYRLLQRFEIPVLGLIAYNAGQGRVSRWRREKWASSSIILHEGLPYEETRHYIRKIFVTALHYGYLYHDASPGEIFSYLFSDIQSHNLE